MRYVQTSKSWARGANLDLLRKRPKIQKFGLCNESLAWQKSWFKMATRAAHNIESWHSLRYGFRAENSGTWALILASLCSFSDFQAFWWMRQPSLLSKHSDREIRAILFISVWDRGGPRFQFLAWRNFPFWSGKKRRQKYLLADIDSDFKNLEVDMRLGKRAKRKIMSGGIIRKEPKEDRQKTKWLIDSFDKT